MPFRFRLQKVLDARQRRVDAVAGGLAVARRRTATIVEEAQCLDLEIDRLQGSQDRVETAFPIARRRQLLAWLEHLAGQRSSLQAQLAEARAQEGRLHQEMTSAWQDLEVLKKLEDRQRKQWYAEQLKRENHEMDEMGVLRADRFRREKVSLLREQVADRERTGPPENQRTIAQLLERQ